MSSHSIATAPDRRSAPLVRMAWLLAIGGVILSSVPIAYAQRFYKWTDDRGVVHFSDVPPANVTGVEQRDLRPPPKSAPAVEEGGGSAAPETTPKSATPGATSFEGPSRVIILSRQMPRTGPSGVHLIGEVKNVGGEEAKGVGVTITAVDATQGTPCLHEEAGVSPSTLRSGQTGNFDIDIESPCLYGDPPVDVVPDWE